MSLGIPIEHKFTRKQLLVIFKIAFLEAMALSIILPTVTSTGEIPTSNVLSFTYILKPISLNLYQAFLTQSSTVPFFSESNFSRILNDDIWKSSQCSNGCSTNITPGFYNQTQSVCPSRNNMYLTGTSASNIIIQNTVLSACPGGCASALRSAICVTGANFTATGFQFDDSFRDNLGGISGDVFTIPAGTAGVTIQQVTVTHASSNAINAQGSKQLISQNRLSSSVPPLKVGGNYGILFGGTSDNSKAFLNTIAGFNGSDVAGISVSSGAHNVSIVANTLVQNEFGILLGRSLTVTIQGNTITNNYLGGIILATAIGTIHAGPITISGNTFTNNGFVGATNVNPCNVGGVTCGALQFQGNGCCWDTISVTGNVFADKRPVLAQAYDINIPQGTQYTNVTISGNTLGTTSTGTTINIGITLPKSWSIVDNDGWNPQPTTINVAGATPFTYTDTIADKEQIILSTIGDLNAFTCSIGGTSITMQRSALAQTPVFGSGDSCTFTYTLTAPSFFVIHQ